MTTLAHQPLEQRLDVDDLRDLMRAVAHTTQRLESTHAALHSEVSRLQRELDQTNAALRRSQALAALGEMAAGIAHEVRNPLGSIQLYAQMLAEDVADHPGQVELCRRIDRAVVGLDAVVRDVLRFARDTTIKPQATTVHELFERGLASCMALITDRLVIVRPACAALRLDADVGLVTQALANVIRNAIEAMHEAESPQRKLELSASKRRVRVGGGALVTHVVLRVRDSGPGIGPEVLARVFNPFFTTRATGTGLGLAIVHRIIDAHGGQVNIESNGEAGPGTCLELCLPARATRRERSTRPGEPIEKPTQPTHALSADALAPLPGAGWAIARTPEHSA